MDLGEEYHFEVTNHAALVAVAFMTSLVSSLVQWLAMWIPKGEFVTNGAFDYRVVVVYLAVMTERLFSGMCGALVCAATIYIGCCVGSLRRLCFAMVPYLDVCVREILMVEDASCCNPKGMIRPSL